MRRGQKGIIPNMAAFNPLIVNHSIIFGIGIIGLIVVLASLRLLHGYQRARKQFPGPPIKSFWTGNLHQTLADDVHEKVCLSVR